MSESPCYKCGHVLFNPACDRCNAIRRQYEPAIRTESHWVPCCEHMTVGGLCDVHGRYGELVASTLRSEAADDIELTRKALRACGYRVHLKEKNGAQWVMAAKGIQVRYAHWHPLTNIHQAMQLLQDVNLQMLTHYYGVDVWGNDLHGIVGERFSEPTPQTLINAQCRAIVTACASLEVVR